MSPPPMLVRAKPVWLAGKKNERNITAAFRATFGAPAHGGAMLAVAAATVYRAFLNGAFLGHGPARGPHGHFRVDEWRLDGLLAPGENTIAIEVAGYNVNSYYTLDQPSFLQAEVRAGEEALVATGSHERGFIGRRLHERRQKVIRYSFQRPFTEAWTLRPGWDAWRRSGERAFASEELADLPDRWLIPRRVPHCRFAKRAPTAALGHGKLQTEVALERPWKDRSRTNIGPALGGFPEQELELDPSMAWQRTLRLRGGGSPRPYKSGERLPLSDRSWRLFDFNANLTGFIGARLSVARPTTLYAVFDEILTKDHVDFRRGDTVNLVAWELPVGDYDFESFEPYTLRYLEFAVMDGEAALHDTWVREYANDSVWEAVFACEDRRLVEVFEAGRETFRQNAIDIFMDCPSRERAGWLCDSFFSARTAIDLTGSAVIEQCFIENFLLPERFEHLPEGMLPMCYPADHNDGTFIPNWALWFVVQLEEYLARTGDRALVDRLQPRVRALFAYFDRFCNSDGLLEKLESWVFLEWSKANEFVQDVNYPSNMLFAGALAAAGRIYADQGLQHRASAIAATIRAQSFDGSWFCDRATRSAAGLARGPERTEVCQYYAFFFGIGDPVLHRELMQRLTSDFGPGRVAAGKHVEIHPANAFIGTYLRLELLSRWGLPQQLLDECIGWFSEMAARTGTLWEHLGTQASCNHGFASHVVRALYRDALGVRAIDPIGRTVALRLGESKLSWCHGRIPTRDGAVTVWWSRAGSALRWRCQVPAGWSVTALDERGRSLTPGDSA